MRLTDTITQRTILKAIQDSYERLSTYQKQTATGLRINVPSDDPVGLSRVFWLRGSISRSKQYQSNIDSALDEINAASNTIDNVLDSLLRVKEIAVSCSNSVISQSAMDAGALEVEEILTNLVSAGNNTINNKYMFAGFQTGTMPFVAAYLGGYINAVNYFGDTGQRLVEISSGRSVNVNFAGSSAVVGSPGVFVDATAGVDIFNGLIQLRTDLFAGNITNILNDQGTLSSYISYLQGLAGQLAVNSKEVYNVRNSLDSEILYKDLVRADIEEADPFVAMSGMSNEQVAYQSALQVGARLFSVSLFDFLA